jgi:hypothetical protein
MVFFGWEFVKTFKKQIRWQSSHLGASPFRRVGASFRKINAHRTAHHRTAHENQENASRPNTPNVLTFGFLT